MICPFCQSSNIEVQTVEDGPAFCVDCKAYQDSEDPTNWYPGEPVLDISRIVELAQDPVRVERMVKEISTWKKES